MTSSLNEVGISPVLLQAISQSLATSKTDSSIMEAAANSNGGTSSQQDLVAKFIQQNQNHLGQPEVTATSDSIKTMLKLKMAANAFSKSLPATNSSNQNRNDNGSAADIAMANVLTTLASQGRSVIIATGNDSLSSVSPLESDGRITDLQHVSKNKIGVHKVLVSSNSGSATSMVTLDSFSDDNTPKLSEQEFTVIKGEPENLTNSRQYVMDASKTSFIPEDNQSNTDETFIEAKANSPVDLNTGQKLTFTMADDHEPDNSVVISYGTDSGATPVSSNVPIVCPQIIEHEGKRYILHSSNVINGIVSAEESSSRYISVQSTSSGEGAQVDDELCRTFGEPETIHQQTEIARTINVPVYTDPSTVGVAGSPCPICGDNISGFHYGIFTCESCKGFFKRTVQNKKSFLCHRQGECEITLENRKKCPACRFAKCLVMGMKLEAIRQDRTRGGRSSYAGVTPLDESKRKRPVRPIQRRPTPPNASDSRLVTVLNYGEPSVKPFVPQILTDIMNLESLLNDDDIPGAGEDLSLTDPNVFLNLLQLCEMKLYKIVRWARNLPYFANISTDDQILLLQNCWCELLALTMCWKSLQLTNEIVFFHGQTFDIEKASLLNIADMFLMLLAVVDHFRRLRLDQYECVALKVIILICPDMKGLTDADKLSEHQMRISSALELYTNGHYKSSPNKYGELLLRLTELSRISSMLKEHLLSWMPPSTTSCGLLYELLKGENMKDLV